MGRGSSGFYKAEWSGRSGGAKGRRGAYEQTPTTAKSVENMNEAQLNREIQKQKEIIRQAQAERRAATTQSQKESAMREAFPLGTGGLNKSAATKTAGELTERAVQRGQRLKSAISKQETAQKKLNALETAKKEVKGTGKTQKQVKADRTNTASKEMKWTTAQKQERTSGGGLKPQIIKSGDYEIRGKSVPRIYRNGKEIGSAGSVKEAKAFVALLEKRKKK